MKNLLAILLLTLMNSAQAHEIVCQQKSSDRGEAKCVTTLRLKTQADSTKSSLSIESACSGRIPVWYSIGGDLNTNFDCSFKGELASCVSMELLSGGGKLAVTLDLKKVTENQVDSTSTYYKLTVSPSQEVATALKALKAPTDIYLLTFDDDANQPSRGFSAQFAEDSCHSIP